MIKIKFIHEHDTRNKSRYSEILPGDIIGSLYLFTNALRQEFGTIPKILTITIEETDK